VAWRCSRLGYRRGVPPTPSPTGAAWLRRPTPSSRRQHKRVELGPATTVLACGWSPSVWLDAAAHPACPNRIESPAAVDDDVVGVMIHSSASYRAVRRDHGDVRSPWPRGSLRTSRTSMTKKAAMTTRAASALQSVGMVAPFLNRTCRHVGESVSVSVRNSVAVFTLSTNSHTRLHASREISARLASTWPMTLTVSCRFPLLRRFD